jgi:hypothetical protein
MIVVGASHQTHFAAKEAETSRRPREAGPRVIDPAKLRRAFVFLPDCIWLN